MNAPAVEHDPRSWLSRNGWRIGMVLAALAGGYWWHRLSREQRINVGAVSERWLAEQAFEDGQHPPD